MADKITTRRTARDRRDAGAYRRTRLAERERDLARSQMRALKGRGLVWNGFAAAMSSRLARPAHLGSDPTPSVLGVDHVPTSHVDGATPPCRATETAAAPVMVSSTPPDRSWLPQVGRPLIVAGVRIAAFEVAGGRDQPFYVLVSAD